MGLRGRVVKRGAVNAVNVRMREAKIEIPHLLNTHNTHSSLACSPRSAYSLGKVLAKTLRSGDMHLFWRTTSLLKKSGRRDLLTAHGPQLPYKQRHHNRRRCSE